ncbi:MAG: hypothetical protein RL632_846 [Bacteroidota bacterium]|jgi:hypothetical protein
MSTHVAHTGMKGLIEKAEFNRFGIICVVLTIVGCLGGIAVGLGAIEHYFTLTLVVVPTMATLSLLIAVAPMRSILFAGAISLIVDVSMILYFTLS